MLRGEPGIGKTALLDHVVTAASGFTALRAAGVEIEMELAFAALHQVCAPVLDGLERLPGPQRDALAAAFGLAEGDAPDRLRVGLAVLTLLSENAERQPVLCVIDDAQWLDQASAHALAFVARRIEAEPVALVFGIRDPSAAGHLEGLPELRVEGLSEPDARALVAAEIHVPLDDRVRDRIIAEARGNPLALLELPRAADRAGLAGGFGVPDALPLSARIEDGYRRSVEALPAATRMLLLVAAAEPVGDPSLLWAAARRLGIGSDAALAAESAGLLELGIRVRFRHPLVRSAVYGAAPLGDRRRAHAALSTVTDAEVDPDRRAWHAAQAATAPDARVADELERSAGRAQARGGFAAAAAFLELAAALTPDPARRAGRVLAAARATYEAGDGDGGLALLATAQAGPLDDLQSARVDLLRAQIVFARERGSEAAAQFLLAAKRLEPLDAGLARESYLRAVEAAIVAGRLADSHGIRTVAEAARAAPPMATPRAVDLLLDGLATRFTEGYAAGAALLTRAVAALSAQPLPQTPSEDHFRWMWLASRTASDLWDDEMFHSLASRHVGLARGVGALSMLPIALNIFASLRVHSGDLDGAAALITEEHAITQATGSAPLPYAPLMLASWRGQQTQTTTLFRSAVDDATARGEGAAIAVAEYAVAVLHNGLGNYETAMAAARRACAHDDLVFTNLALHELVEAATRNAAPDRAAAALHQLTPRTRATGTEWALGVEARCRALVSDGADADALYREAIARLGRSRAATHLARTHLVYGEWLRREGRRRDAREQLRTAHELLAAMGAAAFAARAARELRATGEHARQRTVDTLEQLTPQERHIARLVSTGATSKEVAAQLFLSPRTIDAHLRNIFRKLGITSRRQLRTLPLT